MRLSLLAALIAASFFTCAAHAAHHSARPAQPACTEGDCIAFPADAGFINVRDFGAKGNGTTDDTKAINAALAASGGDTGARSWQDRIVYFPDGIYRVSAPLVKRYADGRFASGAILMGQSRDHTIIRLRDGAPGYGDPLQPHAILFTASKLLGGDPKAGGKDYAAMGEGNDAYSNFVENLTVDAGARNPGAIGIDYLANNFGAVRHVRITAGKDSGATAIALIRKWPGPALLEDVRIDGFDIGIDAANTEYSMTLESVTLMGQRSIGLRNAGNVLAVHNLAITDAPSPLVNAAPEGLLVMDGATLASTAPRAREAIANIGYLNLRGVKVSGYGTLLGEEVAASSARTLDGVYEADRKQSGSRQGWSLPVPPVPATFIEPAGKWVSVTAYGAKPDASADSTNAISMAFKSGAATVYFPHGTYYISGNIAIPSSVRRIVGMMSALHAYKDRPAAFRRDQGMLRAVNDRFPLVIEHLALDNSGLGDQVGVEATGKQPLVLRDLVGAGVTTLKRPPQGGEVYLEDSCCGPLDIAGGKGVWARQLDVESGNVYVEDRGAPLWILGFKTEGDHTAIDALQGSRAQVLGGLLYMVAPGPAKANIPAFRLTDAQLYLSYAEEAFNPQAVFPVHLQSVRGGKRREIRAESLPKRTLGRMVPGLAD